MNISKYHNSGRRTARASAIRGFTLVEIMLVAVGVVLLMTLILNVAPYAVRKFHVAQATGMFTQAKTLAVTFVSQEGAYGRLPLTEGAGGIPGNATVVADQAALAKAARIDDILLGEKLIEKPLKISLTKQVFPAGTAVTWDRVNQQFTGAAAPTIDYTGSSRFECRLSAGPTLNTAPSTALGANFRLDGTTAIDLGKRILYAAIPNCAIADALELSKSIDGVEGTELTSATADDRGAVVYAAPAAGTDVTDVYVYITSF